MEDITIEKGINKERIDELGINDWPGWACEVSRFEWHYDEDESFYMIEGEVVVSLPDGREYSISAGDLAFFPEGVKCVWDVREPVRKLYRLASD